MGRFDRGMRRVHERQDGIALVETPSPAGACGRFDSGSLVPVLPLVDPLDLDELADMEAELDARDLVDELRRLDAQREHGATTGQRNGLRTERRSWLRR